MCVMMRLAPGVEVSGCVDMLCYYYWLSILIISVSIHSINLSSKENEKENNRNGETPT
jgi:hypothetical protein